MGGGMDMGGGGMEMDLGGFGFGGGGEEYHPYVFFEVDVGEEE
jgi:hypothetical protein